MAKLTAKQESFVTMMAESAELAQRGFRLLLARSDFVHYFDHLQERGFFDPERNPAPEPAEREGAVRIPYWAALDYLAAVARLAGERNDIPLADKVLNVVRSVSAWRDSNGELQRNHHTNRVFAKILGLVPAAAVTMNDLQFIAEWLNDPYERMLVANALDEGALPRFLESATPEDWSKAVEILRHCTAIQWRGNEQEREPITVVDDFWLQELLKHHAKTCGMRGGPQAAPVLLERIRELFSVGLRREHSRVFRPAIEDHYQNHAWRSPENRMVEALRDVLLGWCEHDADEACAFVRAMLADDLEIVRRVGIYALAQHWPSLGDLYTEFVGRLFESGHLHELFSLLTQRFAEMTQPQKAATLAAIRALPLPERGDDPAALLRWRQQRWLSAIEGKGYEPADQWFAEFRADPTVGRVPEHPDFDGYIESAWGPGPTPYSTAELITLATERVLTERLNGFQEQNVWRGPTSEGLASAVEAAVARTAPQTFLSALNDFLQMKPLYQHAIINGLKQAWEAKDAAHDQVDWRRGWEQLLAFFERIVEEDAFWQAPATDDDHHDWVVTVIADVIHSGTQHDEHAFASELLPRAQGILAILLQKATAADRPADDAMSQALNTPKGRVIEVLFSQTLRAARVSDKAAGTHQETWNAIKGLFEAELAKCRDANFEFSTLCGAYIAQLQYLDQEWITACMGGVFPTAHLSNCICALEGLAYATFSRPVYALLIQRGVIGLALRLELKGRGARERLLERIAAAYLWGEETLDSPRFTYIFESASVAELETMSRVFWMVRTEPLTQEQKERILAFWRRVVEWSAQHEPQAAARLMSSLSLLTTYISAIADRERPLLEAVAPNVHIGHEAYEFIAELLRLAPANPAGVADLLNRMISAHTPDYDYQDRLQTLLRTLAEHGQRENVILLAERLRHLPGIQELYDVLTEAAQR